MPALKNQKHEQFAQQLVIGQKFHWTQGSCYSRAGYKAEGESAEVNASRLLRNANNGIAARVQEIVGAGAKRAAVTIESLMAELEEARLGATSVEQFAAATSAVIAKAKLKGLMLDRVAVGSPDEFGLCQSAEEVIDKLLADSTPHAALALLDQMRAAIEERAAGAAMVVETARPMSPGTETSQALALLRPGPKQFR